MHRNLKAEMARNDITALTLSEKTGIRYQTLTAKIAGTSPITIKEARKIRDAVNPNLTIDELFDEEA
jgi:hypothetical protein